MKYNFDEIISREGTYTYKYDMRTTLFGRNDVLPLWVADMDFRTPDFVLSGIKKRLEHEILGYTMTPRPTLEAIAGWMKNHHNWTVKPRHIQQVCGVVPALIYLVETFTQVGDGIVVQTPVYFPFFSSIENQKRVMIKNPLQLINGRYEMDFEDLENKFIAGAKMIFLCHPHNPGGRAWDRATLEKLGELCLRYRIIVVSDEIHQDLVFAPHKHIPFASLSPEIENITITTSSPSKTFNMAGMASAYIITSNTEYYNRLAEYIKRLHVAQDNVLSHYAVEAAYLQGEEWLKQMLDYLKNNIDFLMTFFKQNTPKIIPMLPEATYLMWLDCRQMNMNDDQLKDFFVNKAGLGLSQGVTFGIEGSGFMRLNFGCPIATLQHATKKIVNAYNQL